MKFNILTLFPEMYESVLNTSIIKKAILKKIIEVNIIDIREFSNDKNKRVDTPPVGGGAGMILKCQPVIDALKSTNVDALKLIMSPRGNTYTQKKAVELSKLDEITILCGHYEGIDERIYSYFDESISIGDYILTGGELPSMILIDSISRLIPDVITLDSLEDESFTNGLLEYSQYTEPYVFENQTVPNILYSGNHEAIKKFRLKNSFELTKKYRPDLYENYNFSKSDLKLIKTPLEESKWYNQALEKGKKFTKI